MYENFILTLKAMEFLVLLFCFVRFVVCQNCLESGNITCFCDAQIVECRGTQTHTLEVQDILSNISSVRALTLKINNLAFEHNYMFPVLNVEDLTLGYGLYNISSDFFSELRSTLSVLHLENNNIRTLDNKPFNSLINLIDLILDYNEISSLSPDAFENLNNLQVLSISNNNLSSIASVHFSHMTSFHILTVSHNNLSSIHNINISSPSLLKLFAMNCSINDTLEKNSLLGLSNLIELDLSYNTLFEIKSNSLSVMKDLKLLNLSFNSIRFLRENAFSELHNLTILDLRNNQISLIMVTSFTGLHSLKILDLSSNNLRAVLCDYTTDFGALEKLHLENNEIKTFTPGTLYYSPFLKELNLEGNSLECSCELTDVAHFLIQNSSMTETNIKSIFCIVPLTLAHMPVVDFKSSKCVPQEPCKITIPEIPSDEDYDYSDDANETLSHIHTSSSLTSTTTDMSYNNSLHTTSPVFKTSLPTGITDIPSTLVTSEATSSKAVTTEVTILASTSTTADATDLTVYPVTKLETTVSNSSSEIEFTSSHSTLIDTTSPGPAIAIKTTSSDSPAKTETTDLAVITETSRVSSTNIGETSVDTTTRTEPFITSSPFGFTKDRLTDDTSVCTLDLLIPNSTLDSELVIHKNFTFDGNIFCLKWSVTGPLPAKSRCIIKYTFALGTQIKNLKCPSHSKEIGDWSLKANIFRFCLTVFADKKSDSCVKVSGKTATVGSETHLTTSAYDTTASERTSTLKKNTNSSVIETTTSSLITDTTFSSTEETSTMSTTPVTYSLNSAVFNVTEFLVFFNNSNYAYVKWQVNKEFPLSQCVLTLMAFTQLFDHNEGTFPCRNTTVILKSVTEDDIFNICLFTKHLAHGASKVCKLSLGDATFETGASKSEDKPSYSSSSMIPLIIILAICLLIVVFIVFKSMFRKKLESEVYHVQEEEEKSRVSIRPSSFHEGSSVRYSYIAKDNPEV